LKFKDFQQTTVERVPHEINFSVLSQLIREGYLRKGLPVSLLGIGIKLKQEKGDEMRQLTLFDD
jgi:DNA polymerase IV